MLSIEVFVVDALVRSKLSFSGSFAAKSICLRAGCCVLLIVPVLVVVTEKGFTNGKHNFDNGQ